MKNSPGEDQPLDTGAAIREFSELTDRINGALGLSMTMEEAALGYVRVANEIMAKPVKAISISRRFNIKEHALFAFGGAGASHACSIAKILGIKKVIVHPLAGLFSAYGIAMADHLANGERTVLLPFTKDGHESLKPLFEKIEEDLTAEMKREGTFSPQALVSRYLDLRPSGAEGYLTVKDTGYEGTKNAFVETFDR